MKARRETDQDREQLRLFNWVRRVFILLQLCSQYAGAQPTALQLEASERDGKKFEPLPSQATAAWVAGRLEMPPGVIAPAFYALAELGCIEVALLAQDRDVQWRFARNAEMPTEEQVEALSVVEPASSLRWPGRC